MPRLGKNLGGYFGDTIDIGAVLRDTETAARQHGWRPEPLETGDGLQLQTWHRAAPAARRRLYISTGIHGDEPAGPLAARQLLQDNFWRTDLEVWLCPCLNPTGFPLNRRENRHGIDLNRQYLHLEAAETRAHVAWLDTLPSFDLALCLHEDWEANGFYLYELNPDQLPSHAAAMIRTVAEVCPIDLSPEIEGRPANGGVICPSADPASRPQWPEAFYLFTRKTRLSYTLEAPSDFPLPVRVQALVRAVETVIARL
jgi:protein MpaA